MYTYAWYHWLTFFYLYCFLGWVFESAYVSLKKGRPVNRGFLRLPMLPLYGTGAVMMLWVSLPVKDNLVLVYLSGVVAATLLEYATGRLMELLFKVRYWDYSNQPFNAGGYICLSSSVAWGFLTLFMTEVIHRPIEHAVLDLAPGAEAALLLAVTALFVYDTVHSIREALSLARVLRAITSLRADLDNLQVQLSLLKAEAAQNVQAFKENVKESMAAPVLAGKEAIGSRKESLESRITALSEMLNQKREALRIHTEIRRPAILRRNPGAASSRFASALKELRAAWEGRKPQDGDKTA